MRRILALVVVLGVLLPAREAAAQVHWSASAGAGVMKRWYNRAPEDPSFGPSAELAAHFALLPLVHVGAYFGGDLSPVEDRADRSLLYGGLGVRGFIPIFPASMRGWIGTGFGTGAALTGRGSGGFFEVPLRLGVSYRIRKPWSVFAEVTGRAVLAPYGKLYPGETMHDTWALGLSVGAMLDL